VAKTQSVVDTLCA